MIVYVLMAQFKICLYIVTLWLWITHYQYHSAVIHLLRVLHSSYLLYHDSFIYIRLYSQVLFCDMSSLINSNGRNSDPQRSSQTTLSPQLLGFEKCIVLFLYIHFIGNGFVQFLFLWSRSCHRISDPSQYSFSLHLHFLLSSICHPPLCLFALHGYLYQKLYV